MSLFLLFFFLKASLTVFSVLESFSSTYCDYGISWWVANNNASLVLFPVVGGSYLALLSYCVYYNHVMGGLDDFQIISICLCF